MFIIVKEIKAKHYYFDRKLETIKTTITETLKINKMKFWLLKNINMKLRTQWIGLRAD